MSETKTEDIDIDTLVKLARRAKARANKATEPPWFIAYRRVCSEPRVRSYDAAEALIPDDAPEDDPRWDALPEVDVCTVPVVSGDTPTAQGAIDGDFIAHARLDVPALADCVIALADRLAWLKAENERLKEVIRAQDAAAGTLTARLELRSRSVIVTAPGADEHKIAQLFFAAAATGLQITAIKSLMMAVGNDRAAEMFDEMFSGALPEDSEDGREAPPTTEPG